MGKTVRRRAAVLRSVECRSQSYGGGTLSEGDKSAHDSYIFAGTVEDNLRMGKADATQKEMEDALFKSGPAKDDPGEGRTCHALEERAAKPFRRAEAASGAGAGAAA